MDTMTKRFLRGLSAIFCAACTWLLSTQCVWAELTASVDATEITIDQSLNFTLSTTKGTGDPDFSALQIDFDILGQSTFSQTQSHNGKIIQNLSWRLQLLPKRKGTYTIPAITVAGETSDPIEITVTEPRVVNGADFGDFHVEVAVDRLDPYVQSQVVYTIRVYHAVNFMDGSLSAPEAAGVQVESLGEDRVYQENRNGRVYRVLERRFALFPQNSGVIVVPGVVLNANVPAAGGNRGFFAARQPVRRRAADLELNVQPRPADDQSPWWLPASQVQIDARWEGDPTTAYVGESITRTLTLQAAGVASVTLPELTPPTLDTFRVYADQPELTQQPTPDGLISRRVEKWAVIPQTAGEVTLPPISVTWFNTQTNRFETADIPETRLQVQPARNAVTGEVRQETASGTSGDATTLSAAGEIPDTTGLPGDIETGLKASDTRDYWRALAILALVGWLCTVLAWWRSRRRQQPNGHEDTANAPPAPLSLRKLESVSQHSDTRSFAGSLVTWAQGFWSGNPPGSLVGMAQRIEQQSREQKLPADSQVVVSELASDLRSLDASLYASSQGAGTVPLDTAMHAKIVKSLRQFADTTQKTEKSATRSELPSL
ncbi:MAG: BatD family protein [Gammaproteobacteria bacterium]|nr:BatD family protein [Gammaproteobacteria bacterium]